ncbi:MAG: hypothetical protein H7Y14_04325, partial [Burkholderiales bacterium]|nr:hypothetical protein [Burkholderiales bacterium]
MKGVILVDSVTQLDREARGMVAVCGSHGGMYAAWVAARAGVRAVVLNDAGIGKHSAGIAGVLWLAGLDIPAVAIDHRSARIGDGQDMMQSGIVSTVNDAGAKHGCLPGHTCKQVVKCLLENSEESEAEIPEIGEARARIGNTGHREVWAIDSVSLARPEDRRAILVTGSHGALLGGRPDHVLDVDVFAAFFNDAGGGKDGA